MFRSLFDRVQNVFLTGRGRPAALAILVWMASLNLYSDSDWSTQHRNSLPGKVGELFSAPLRSARQTLFDGYQQFHPRQPQSQPVTIVAIDEASLKQIGQWPWPRNRTAALIAAIAAQRPAAIGLDIYMPEEDQTSPAKVADNLPPKQQALAQALRRLPSHEQELAAALRAAPTVLGAAGFDFPTLSTSAGLRTVPIMVTGNGDPLAHVRAYPWVLASLPELQAAASGQAVLTVATMQGGIVRRLPLIAAINGQLVPGLALEMLRVATGTTIGVTMETRGVHHVTVADLSVPTQENGEIWLHFSRWQAGQARYVSAADVLNGKVDAELLSSKLVLVGLTGLGLSDQRITALGEMVPGIEIQAQMIESLFDGGILLRPWWMKWLETLLIITCGGLLIHYIPRKNSLATLVRKIPGISLLLLMALNLLIAASGHVLFIQSALLFDASATFVTLSSVLGSLISSAMIEVGRDNVALELERQGLREEAARAAGELSAARRIQLGSLPQAGQLFGDEKRFELVALLEPAKDVGGDLYDFFMIDPQRLGFVIGDVSGKGLPASLFMAFTKTLTKTIAKYVAAGPGRIAELTNAELAEFNSEALFVTALVGVLDVDSGLLTLVNAGHDSPWLVHSDGRQTRLASPPGAGGPPLCVIDDFPYSAQQVQLQAGDLLVMYTDGITEAMNAAGELYGSARLAAVLRDAGGASAHDTLSRLRADVCRHVADADASDDLSLLLIRWTPTVSHTNGPA